MKSPILIFLWKAASRISWQLKFTKLEFNGIRQIGIGLTGSKVAALSLMPDFDPVLNQYTSAFSDRPARDASFVKMAEFLSGLNFDPNNPPNAALMIRGANETADAIVVELSAPQYDEVNATLMYSAKVTYDLEFESGWAQDFAQKGDAAIPESFGAVILVIDDCPCMDYRSCPSGWHDSCWKFPFCNPTCGGCC